MNSYHSTEPLLPTTYNNNNNISIPENTLQTLPPFYQDGALKYYLIWILRFIVFAMSGSLSLKLSEWVLDTILPLKVSRYIYILLLLLLETLAAYPLTVFTFGTLFGQSRFFGRLVYKGWGRFLLPKKIKEKWSTSTIWI